MIQAANRTRLVSLLAFAAGLTGVFAACQSGDKQAPAAAKAAGPPKTGPLTVEQGMTVMSDADYETQLERAAKSRVDLQDMGQVIVATFARIDWSTHAELQPHLAEVKEMAAEVEKSARSMADAAKAGDGDKAKKLAGTTLDNCTACHIQYRPKK